MEIYEVYVRPDQEWKMLASFETEADAIGYVKNLVARRKVSWRVVKERFDPVSETFVGRRVLQEKIFEDQGIAGKGPAAKAREMERLVEERQKRVTGGTLGVITPNEAEDDSTVFERFVMMRRKESKDKGEPGDK
ncbi:hypothetical protein ACFSM5_03395 [Lacibacterium aquatile]|uniref:DUF2188 domain-containing protein n=1 Tax=Lacibacterium aquatile TaxID=1168082 RepID=A0ABW5DLB5_9PROT